MSSSYYVIREGKVRGKGRYWREGGVWTDNRDLATRLEGPWFSHAEDERMVRVTRKPKVDVAGDNLARALTAQRQVGFEQGRLAALDEAAELVRSIQRSGGYSTHIPDAIAALKEKP